METLKDYWFIIDTLLIPLVTYLIGQYKSFKKEFKQSKKNDVVLMKSDLLRQFNNCNEKGCRSQYETDLFLAMQQEYFASGGNSFIEELGKEFLSLPLK